MPPGTNRQIVAKVAGHVLDAFGRLVDANTETGGDPPYQAVVSLPNAAMSVHASVLKTVVAVVVALAYLM